MPVSCCAYGCTNRRESGGEIQFFGFPLKNEELTSKWVSAIKRKSFTPTKYSRICSIHFQDSDYLVRPGINVKHLKPDAVPSIFPAFPTYHQPKIKIPRQRRKQEATEELDVPDSSTAESLSLHETKYCDREVQTEGMSIPYKIGILQKKLKISQQRVRRQKSKIDNFQDLLKTMKNKGYFDDSALNFLLEHFEGTALKIFKNQLSNSKCLSHGVRYSDELKKFALTLHYYSSKAYNFCR